MTRIFADTEFNGFNGELISIGLISETGASFYAIVEDWNEMELDPWVEKHVVPVLDRHQRYTRMLSKDRLRERLCEFLRGFDDVTVVTDWPVDVQYICDLLITGPGTMVDIPGIKFEVIRINPYDDPEMPQDKRHNALADAVTLMHAVSKRDSLAKVAQKSSTDLKMAVATFMINNPLKPAQKHCNLHWVQNQAQLISNDLAAFLCSSSTNFRGLTPVEVLYGCWASDLRTEDIVSDEQRAILRKDQLERYNLVMMLIETMSF